MDRTNHATDEFDLINLQKLKPSRIVTDGDLDGIASAAILLRAFPNAEVTFAHPPGIRSGVFDEFIDKSTIFCPNTQETGHFGSIFGKIIKF